MPGDELFEGAMVVSHKSTSYYDDLTWAAAWLNLATNDFAYFNDAFRLVFYWFTIMTSVHREQPLAASQIVSRLLVLEHAQHHSNIRIHNVLLSFILQVVRYALRFN